MARRNPYSSDISVHYDAGAVDMVKTYSYMLDEFRMSRFTDYLGETIYRAADRRFNAYMSANSEEYKHMFEWGTKGTTAASRLWATIYNKGIVTYTYRESRKLVPPSLPNTKYRHVFREKAQQMEEAPIVIIAPVKAQYLRWRGEGGEEVRHRGEVITEVAGGVFRNKFQNAFLLFWATGGGGTMDEMLHAVRSSPKFRMELKRNQLNGLKQRLRNQEKKASVGDAKARALAAQRIEELKREVIKRGGTL